MRAPTRVPKLAMPTSFDPIQLGAIAAPNRILIAPLTRGRNTHDHVPTEVMVDYYVQRASAGLIISEATGISLQGLGWSYGPGSGTRPRSKDGAGSQMPCTKLEAASCASSGTWAEWCTLACLAASSQSLLPQPRRPATL